MKRLLIGLVVIVAGTLALVICTGCDLRYTGSPSPNVSVTPTPSVSPPVITLFTAELFQQKGGTRTTLSWDVAGTSMTCRVDPGVGNVPQVGFASVVLPFVSTSTLVTYTLACVNAAGAANRALTIHVTP